MLILFLINLVELKNLTSQKAMCAFFWGTVEGLLIIQQGSKH